MFCQECGAKNEDSSLFCESCGVKLERNGINRSVQAGQNEISQLKPTVNNKPMSKKSKVILCAIAALLIVVSGSYHMLKTHYSSEKAAKLYFLNVMEGKWAEVYDWIDLPQSEYLSKDKFLEIYGEQDGVPYNSYKIESTKKNSLSNVVKISYRAKGDFEDQIMEVTLNKQKKKGLLIFNTWKVEPSEYLVENYSIRVPKNTEVTFGGVKLDSTRITQSDDYGTEYTLPQIFKGEYEVKVTQQNMKDVIEKIMTQDYGFSLDEMVLDEKVEEALVAKSQEFIQQIYKAGIDKAEFGTVAGYFSKEDKVLSAASERYKDFIDTIYKEDGTGITSINFYDFSGQAKEEYEEDIMLVHVTLNFGYEVNYKYTDIWTGELATNTGSGYEDNSFTYRYEEGNWALKSCEFGVNY